MPPPVSGPVDGDTGAAAVTQFPIAYQLGQDANIEDFLLSISAIVDGAACINDKVGIRIWSEQVMSPGWSYTYDRPRTRPIWVMRCDMGPVTIPYRGKKVLFCEFYACSGLPGSTATLSFTIREIKLV